MSKIRLSESEIDKIVAMLTTWSGKLTWEHLLVRVEVFLKRPFTRQGLDKNPIIKLAYQQAKARQKKALRQKPKADDPNTPPELASALRRIDNLKAELELVRAQNEQFIEKFATWLYNARARGVSEFDLNAKLPAIDRHGSE